MTLDQEVGLLLRELECVVRERDELRGRPAAGCKLATAERRLEQLHWRLAYVARRQANDLRIAA